MLPPIPPPDNHWLDNLGLTFFAAFAGLLGYLMRNANNRRKVTWQRCVLETGASGFIGFLTVMLCRASSISFEWMGFMAGVLGWLGATASIQLFERVVRRKLGLNDVDHNIDEGAGGGVNGGGLDHGAESPAAHPARSGATPPVSGGDSGS